MNFYEDNRLKVANDYPDGLEDPSLPKTGKGHTRPSHNSASQLQEIQNRDVHKENLEYYLRRKTTEDDNH